MAATDEYLSLRQVVALLPPGRCSAEVHASTVTRWILKGCRAADGTRVKLRAVRAGCRWLVTRASLEEFLADCAAGIADAPDVAARTPAQSARAAERAGAELEKMGV